MSPGISLQSASRRFSRGRFSIGCRRRLSRRRHTRGVAVSPCTVANTRRFHADAGSHRQPSITVIPPASEYKEYHNFAAADNAAARQCNKRFIAVITGFVICFTAHVRADYRQILYRSTEGEYQNDAVIEAVVVNNFAASHQRFSVPLIATEKRHVIKYQSIFSSNIIAHFQATLSSQQLFLILFIFSSVCWPVDIFASFSFFRLHLQRGHEVTDISP